VVPCDLSVPANVVGILLEVVGLLIVIWHDWRREQERRLAQRASKSAFVEARTVTAKVLAELGRAS